MNAWEKTVDLLIAIVILFLVPILYYGSGQRVSKALLAGQAGEHFLRCVSTAGEITLPVWKELEHTLDVVGCDGFELKRERLLYEPHGESGEIIECSYVKETEEIRTRLEETERFCLQAGDRLWLTIIVNQVPTVYYQCARTGGGSP